MDRWDRLYQASYCTIHYLFSLQIGMPQANALNSIGYTDTVPFLTIRKPDIYLRKSLGKSATVFFPSDQ
jgi:hypothetical protein